MFQMKDHDEDLLFSETSLSAECRENEWRQRLTDCVAMLCGVTACAKEGAAADVEGGSES